MKKYTSWPSSWILPLLYFSYPGIGRHPPFHGFIYIHYIFVTIIITTIITTTTICHYHHHNHRYLSLSSSQPPPSHSVPRMGSACYLPLLIQFSKSEIYKVNLRTWKITFVAFVLGIFLLKFDGPHLGGQEKNWRVAEKSSNPYPSNKWKPPKAKRIIGGLVAQKTDENMQRFQCMKSTRPRLSIDGCFCLLCTCLTIIVDYDD